MEIADCKLKVGGDHSNVVTKFDITPAEMVVLTNLHGPGSVIELKIKPLTQAGKDPSKRSHRFELQRLRGIYQGDPGATNDGITGSIGSNNGSGIKSPSIDKIVNMLFPGINPVLPINFADIVFTEEQDEDGDADVESEESGDEEPTLKAKPAPKPSLKAKPGRKRTRVVEPEEEEITA